MSPDSCFSSCPCGGVFITSQNHDTGRLSAWHRVPSVMHYQIPDCFLSCTSKLLRYYTHLVMAKNLFRKPLLPPLPRSLLKNFKKATAKHLKKTLLHITSHSPSNSHHQSHSHSDSQFNYHTFQDLETYNVTESSLKTSK